MFYNKYSYTDFHELNLDFILNHFSEFMGDIESLNDWRVEHEAEYEQLKALYDAIVSGDFPESMIIALNNWLVANGADIIAEFVRMVFFGLTDTGHFVAYIPDSWDNIIFGTTGLDDFPIGVDYGHLTISY